MVANEIGEPVIRGCEKFAFEMRRFLFAHADRQRADNRRLLKRLFAFCRSCGNCRLPKTFFVCTENCPKRLANGPCGGVRPDGGCEFGSGECVHSRIVRIAHWRGQIQHLEEEILDPGR